MATFWRDLGKTSKDLLEKDFPTDSWGVEVETKSTDVKFKNTATRKPDGSTAATFEPTLSLKPHGIEIKATAKTDKSFSAEVSHEDKLLEGVKIALNGENKGGDKNTVKASLDWKNKRFGTFTTTFTYPLKGNPSVTATGTASYENFTAGGNVEYALGSQAGVSAWNAKLLYKAAAYSFLLYANSKAGDETVVGVNYLHSVRPDLDILSDVHVDTNKIGDVPRFKLLAKYAKDSQTTLKAKIESDSSKLAWSVTHKLTPEVSVVFGSEHSLAASGAGSTKAAGTLKLNF